MCKMCGPRPLCQVAKMYAFFRSSKGRGGENRAAVTGKKRRERRAMEEKLGCIGIWLPAGPRDWI